MATPSAMIFQGCILIPVVGQNKCGKCLVESGCMGQEHFPAFFVEPHTSEI